MFDLREAFGWLADACLYGDPSVRVSGVCTDTRSIAEGELFVALRGERFDAHEFISLAQQRGAAAVIFDRWVDGIRAPAIRVADTRRALGEIARGWRSRLPARVVTVSGANGKTTVKEMLSAVLAQAFGADARLATRGNLNNDVGVPLTLLRLRAQHRAAVIELGTNHPGEIAWLAQVARPDVALVNNAQREHQEFLDGTEGSARENGASITALSAEGVAVFPGDDAQAPVWRTLAGSRRRIEFGLDGALQRFEVAAAANAESARFEMKVGDARATVRLPVEGLHNVRNALAAAACAHALGIDAATIAHGLEAFAPPPGRLVRRRAAAGAALIDDTYNANPDSVRAAIDVLAHCAGLRVLVLGDMGEVGERGPEFHREVGTYARERGIDRLLAIGAASAATVDAFGAGAAHHDDVDSLVASAAALAGEGATVLVKGSRFMRMERVVAALAEAPVAA
ncbi:MAG: UDP-N-acetylmuramoyl-tripeptide--D-alanyl-D-alanine ligase [Burkholderiaceae bacterium]|nr:UDP-N-acetylmuramoyl-tripeptide--D-alanyl-D-alanine ligase [Burkholderiaceae bacterium]